MTAPRYKIIDVETTGLDATAKVVEVAWVEIDDQLNVLDERSSLIDPGVPIPAGASAVNGIYDKDVVGKPTLQQFYVDAWEDGPVYLAAHSAAFDMRFLGQQYEQVHGTLCTLALARRTVKGPANYRLGTLAEFFNIEQKDAHRALDDVKTTLQILSRIISLTEVSLPTWLARQNKPAVLHTMPFGKYRGYSFLDIPIAYRRWALEQEMPADVRFSFEQAEKARK